MCIINRKNNTAMKRTLLHNLLFVILAAAMTLGFASCNKDDDKPTDNGGDPTEQEGEAPAPDTFWDVLAQIVQADQITSDYEGKTFEPAIGVEDASSSYNRIVYINNMAAAAQSFANLTGADVSESTPSYEWKDDKVGTMTYTKVNDGRDFAVVEVNIAAVPHLSKIIYRNGAQSDANASFEGSAYYRFGDVISRKNKDNKTEYWVCVRPAFGPEKKEETHWMSVSPLPSDKIWTYTSSHGIDYALPKDLKYSQEHMQNFAEMLFAMCYPETWVTNITYYSPKMFHDFESKNIKYHNASFWTNVADYWKAKNIDKLVFGKTLSELSAQLADENVGLSFLYYGSAWTTWFSNYATLYQAKYVNKAGGKYSNMQTKDPCTKIQPLMVDKKNSANDIKLNIKDECTADKPYIVNKAIFGDETPRWIVRYATGAELSDTKAYKNKYGPISGVTDVYRYYHDVNPQEALEQYGPEETKRVAMNNDKSKWDLSDFEGRGHYRFGDVYKDQNGHRWFVVYISGLYNNPEAYPNKERSPYAELVSFDGLTASADRSRITNLPTFDQAVRGAVWLRDMFSFACNSDLSSKVELGIYNNTGVDARDWFQLMVARSKDPRNATNAATVGYRDDSVEGGQPLFRFMNPIDLDNEHPPFFIRKHYPSKPDSISDTYNADGFSNVPIVLQDVADSVKVVAHRPDFYACQPLDKLGGGDGTSIRLTRQSPDARAKDVTNYIYDYTTWRSHSYATDMWNEPVLMFRITAVYDRGNEYATETIDGLQLTLLAQSPFYDPDEDVDEAAFSTAYARVAGESANFTNQTSYLDGKDFVLPSWKTTWE